MNEQRHLVNNCDPKTNGEMFLWNYLSKDCKIMFDVGCHTDNYYVLEHPSIIFHLFEPHPGFFETAASKCKDCTNVFMNNIGLGMEECTLDYYERGQSFVNRFGEQPSRQIQVTTIDKYMEIHEISHIDFLKIDVEGFEYDVIKGSLQSISKIKHIQFEYGGTFPERNVLLKDVYDMLEGRQIYMIGPDGLYSRQEAIEHKQYCNYLATNDAESLASIIRS